MKLKKKKVPIEIRRLVTNHLESIRNSEIGRKFKQAYIGDDVTPIYRPDIKNVARFLTAAAIGWAAVLFFSL